MRYEIELYDHKDQQKVIVYAYAETELAAALSVMDKIPMKGQIKNIKEMREFYMTSQLQFIGIKEDKHGGSHEIQKSDDRSKNRRNSSRKSHR